jgi:hypothetical protein
MPPLTALWYVQDNWETFPSLFLQACSAVYIYAANILWQVIPEQLEGYI